MGNSEEKVKLQVMVCAYGREGLMRFASGSHPRMEGVEYLVSWQRGGATEIPSGLLEREDVKVCPSDTRGLSVNRNLALSQATAPLLLVSDDDVDYTREQLATVISAFASHPDADLIAFRYESKTHAKAYPLELSSLARLPKGHYISSIELAFRRESVKEKVDFNENFGIGSVFPSGEEDIFVKDCIDAGLNCLYLPATIARHDGSTSSGRNLRLASRPMTKGAVFLRLHPKSWLLRMLVHAAREFKPWMRGEVPNPLSYCLNWLRGVRLARKMKLFRSHD